MLMSRASASAVGGRREVVGGKQGREVVVVGGDKRKVEVRREVGKVVKREEG